MKYIAVVFMLSVLSCSKKVMTKTTSEISTKDEILAVLKSIDDSKDEEELIKNSGLLWKGFVNNSGEQKIAIIKVPENSQEIWIERLRNIGVFNDVVKHTPESLHTILSKQKNSFLKYRKTICKGNCPAFEVILFKNKKLSFKGIVNTTKIGLKEILLTNKQFNELEKTLNKTTFNSYKNIYKNSLLADSPSTIITFKNKEVTINSWNKAPIELQNFENILTNILKENNLL